MFYSKEELSSLNRKALQKLSKQFGVKANGKNCELVDRLYNYFLELQKEEKSLEDDLKQEAKAETAEEPPKVAEVASEWISDDEENIPPENNEQLKEDLMKEVEKRAQEKITQIPRFNVANVYVPGQLLSPASKNMFTKRHSKDFKKLDSIDVYVEKKRQRAEQRFAFHKKLKLDAKKTINRMKMAHNTPGDPNTKRTKSPMFKKVVDKEISFNFVSKLKSPKPVRTSPRLSILKEKNMRPALKQPSWKPSPGVSRKSSVHFTNLAKPKTGDQITKLNQSVPDWRSPLVKESNSAKKTPAKFDLQASLKKRLSYKPHTGKMKESYFEGCSATKADANQTFDVSSMDTKKSVKEMTTKTTKTREQRRAAVTKRRDNKREDMLSKRRGIVS